MMDSPHTAGWGHHPLGFEATGYASFGAVTVPSAGGAGVVLGDRPEGEGEFFQSEITDFHLVTQAVRASAGPRR